MGTWPGGGIGIQRVPSLSSASGVWNLNEQLLAKKSSTWPLVLEAPQTISGMLTWYDASDLTTVTVSSGSVTAWADKSGNGKTLVSPSGRNPGYTSGQALTFNGTQFMYSDLGYNAPTTRTMYVVCTLYQLDPPASSTGGGVLGFENSSSDSFDTIVYNENSARKWQTGSSGGARNVVAATSETRVNQRILMTVTYGNGHTRIYRMGSLDGSSNSFTPASNQNRIIVGQRHNTWSASPPSNGYWFGTVSECITYNTIHSDSDRQKIETYLNTKWSIS